MGTEGSRGPGRSASQPKPLEAPAAPTPRRGPDKTPRKPRGSMYAGQTCSVEGCSQAARSNAMCTRHDNAARERARHHANGGGCQADRNLSDQTKQAIRDLAELGASRREIARMVGCSASSVGNVLRGRR